MGGGDLLNLSFERYTYQEGSARFCVVEVYSPLARDETKQTRCALFPHRVKSEWVSLSRISYLILKVALY
jgi:hypothetical protein